jgi:hypothetical protein
MQPKNQISRLSELMTPASLDLLSASGSDLVRQIGMDVVRGVVLDVLTGKNLRDSTESLTRRRIAALNLATVNLFVQGSALSDDFVEQLPSLAAEILTQKQLTKAERWLAQWVLGLTDKAFQNVLRDNPNALKEYRHRFVTTCQQVVSQHAQQWGELKGSLQLTSGAKAELNWLWLTYLLNTIGAQTLAIRGSEKSAYGKLFEKLVLGSLLSILGFKHISPPPTEFERVFWLSSRAERRESDATLLYEAGKGVRFDIGFIGRGNPEISLDKVTRFEREIEMGRSRYYMATIILVDRIGANSRIEQLAQAVDGNIVQMSSNYWPRQVAEILHHRLGFSHWMLDVSEADFQQKLAATMHTISLEPFIGLAEDFSHNAVREEAGGYS